MNGLSVRPTVYDVGDLPKITATFGPETGRVDPTTVTFKVKAPSGVTTTLVYGTDVGVVREDLGVYRIQVSATEPGLWIVRVESTGNGQAAEEHVFNVRTRKVS